MPLPEEKPVEEAGKEEGGVGRVPWTVREVWIGVAVLAAWMAGVALTAVLIRLYNLDVDVGLYLSLGELVLLAPVWVLAVRKARNGWAAVGLRAFPAGAVGIGCGMMIASYLLNVVYSLILMQFDLQMQVDLVPILTELDRPWLFVVGAAVVAPLVEEIFFRGFVYAGLRQRFDWKVAAAVSAALFAVIHLQPLGILPIFVLGVIFAFLYEWSGSIWPAILMHLSTNTLAVAAAYAQMWLKGIEGLGG